MISVAHGICAAVVAVILWRALAQVWVDELTAELVVRDAIRLGILAFSAAASGLAIVAGLLTAQPRRFFALDAVSWSLLLPVLFALALGRLDRDYIGVLFVVALAIRIAPAVIACVQDDRAWPFLFATAFTVYASLAAWHQGAALPLGDQVHYLVAADRLAHGSVDGTLDAALFRRLSTLVPSELDFSTHAVQTPFGPRTIQGYALPLLLLPGWIVAERFGAELVVALAGAAAATMTALILRDTIASVRLRGAVWAMTSFLAPGVLLAFHIFPNAFGAAAIGVAYRFGVTASHRRPALAGAAAGLCLLLAPRDGLVLIALLAAIWWIGRRDFVRFAAGAAAVGLLAVIANAALYALPLPYAGYLLAVASAEEILRESTFSFRFWVGLPGVLFDRTFGIAGVAPWLFIAVIGLPAALRADRRVFAPAVIAIALSLVVLALFRYWEGGYAPPARYFVDMLPLVAPLVGYGFAVMRDLWMRAFAALLVGISALGALVLCAMPARASNDAFQQQLQELLDAALGLNPIGWLPSFQPTTPDWYVGAYLRLLPAVAIVAGLAAYGWRQRAVAAHPVAPLVCKGRAVLVGFVVANAVALGITLFAVSQPWLAGMGDLREVLITRWLPAALAIATVLSAVIGLHLDPGARLAFFARHFALYLAVPLTLLALRGSFLSETRLGVLYLAIAVGLAANALHALWRVAPRVSGTRAAVLLGATMLAIALIVLPYDRTIAPTASDEPHYLIIVQSLIFDRDLDLTNDYAGDRYFAFYPERLPDTHAIQAGGQLFPLRDLALPVLLAIPYALAERTGALVLMCLFGALLAAQLYLLLRDLAFDARVAVAAVGATVFVHPFLTYTTQLYPDLIAAVVFVTVVRLIQRGTLASLRELALASAFTGTLPWLTTRSWFVAIGLGLVIAYAALWARRDVVRRFLAASVPFALLILLLSYVNWRMFGLFMPSAGYFIIREQQEVVRFWPHVGIPGLFFDRAFGLVPRAAIYLLAFLGAGALWRRRRAQGVALAALVLGWGLYLLFIADIFYWHADGGPPSRYLLAGLPFLAVGVAGGIETALAATGPMRTALVSFTWIAAWWSTFIVFLYAVAPDLRYEYLPQILAGNTVKLWEAVGRVIRPDVQFALPLLYLDLPANLPLALFWIALAGVLVTLGVRLGSRPLS